MIQSATYRQLWSLILLLGFLIPFGIREVHHIAEHAEEQVHCQADGSNKHLHSEEFAAHHCYICAVQLSEYFAFEFLLPHHKPNFLLSNIISNQRGFIPQRITFSYLQRGPPNMLSF